MRANGVRLFGHAAGRTVCVTHMHGLRDLKGKRAAQAHRVVRLFTTLADASDLSVVCGDFNVAPESDALRILNRAGQVDLGMTRAFTGTRTAPDEKPGKFADCMLINRVDRVRAFDVVRAPQVSDHCPLVLMAGPAPQRLRPVLSGPGYAWDKATFMSVTR